MSRIDIAIEHHISSCHVYLTHPSLCMTHWCLDFKEEKGTLLLSCIRAGGVAFPTFQVGQVTLFKYSVPSCTFFLLSVLCPSCQLHKTICMYFLLIFSMVNITYFMYDHGIVRLSLACLTDVIYQLWAYINACKWPLYSLAIMYQNLEIPNVICRTIGCHFQFPHWHL